MTTDTFTTFLKSITGKSYETEIDGKVDLAQFVSEDETIMIRMFRTLLTETATGKLSPRVGLYYLEQSLKPLKLTRNARLRPLKLLSSPDDFRVLYELYILCIRTYFQTLVKQKTNEKGTHNPVEIARQVSSTINLNLMYFEYALLEHLQSLGHIRDEDYISDEPINLLSSKSNLVRLVCVYMYGQVKVIYIKSDGRLYYRLPIESKIMRKLSKKSLEKKPDDDVVVPKRKSRSVVGEKKKKKESSVEEEEVEVKVDKYDHPFDVDRDIDHPCAFDYESIEMMKKALKAGSAPTSYSQTNILYFGVMNILPRKEETKDTFGLYKGDRWYVGQTSQSWEDRHYKQSSDSSHGIHAAIAALTGESRKLDSQSKLRDGTSTIQNVDQRIAEAPLGNPRYYLLWRPTKDPQPTVGRNIRTTTEGYFITYFLQKDKFGNTSSSTRKLNSRTEYIKDENEKNRLENVFVKSLLYPDPQQKTSIRTTKSSKYYGDGDDDDDDDGDDDDNRSLELKPEVEKEMLEEFAKAMKNLPIKKNQITQAGGEDLKMSISELKKIAASKEKTIDTK